MSYFFTLTRVADILLYLYTHSLYFFSSLLTCCSPTVFYPFTTLASISKPNLFTLNIISFFALFHSFPVTFSCPFLVPFLLFSFTLSASVTLYSFSCSSRFHQGLRLSLSTFAYLPRSSPPLSTFNTRVIILGGERGWRIFLCLSLCSRKT